MRYLLDLNFKSLLVLAGVSFFALTLYSKELIAYLMEFDSTETNSLDQKNQSMKMSKDSLTKDLDLVSSNLEVKKLEQLPVLMGEKDVLKTIQLLPGIQSGNEGSAGFYVRGGGVDQNLILLDEATIYNASHLFGFFSVFNSDAINAVSYTHLTLPTIYSV